MNKNNKQTNFFSLSNDKVSATILLVPALIFCTVFIFIPAIGTIIGSFYSYSLTSMNNWKWVGLGNYVKAAQDEYFWVALKNNFSNYNFYTNGYIISCCKFNLANNL